MISDERFASLEQAIHQLRLNQKDHWDKFSAIAAALIPLAIAGVGGYYSYTSGQAETEIAQIKAEADSKIRQAELVSKFFEPLTGDDEEKRKFAVDSLLVAAPDYGPMLVRVFSRSTATPESSNYANRALEQRRDTLIREMYADDAEIRKEAFRQLLSAWDGDDSLVAALIDYATQHVDNRNGTYNAVVLLKNMQREALRSGEQQILEFLTLAERNGPSTRQQADALRIRLTR